MQTLPLSLRIGVLRGGPSSDYDVSLKTGAHVLKHLAETHSPIDIFISHDGKWHMQGIERTPERILKNVDVIFNAMHGSYGEDGGVQEVLEYHGIPYTGSGRFQSAVAMNRWICKKKVGEEGIKTPLCFLVRQEDSIEEKAKEIFNSITSPLVVKPACGGSSRGFYLTHSFSELLSVLREVLAVHGSAIVEEYIKGKEVSCLITNNFRGQDTYAFPPNEKLRKDETITVESMAKKIHQILELSHYSSSDFIVSPRRGVYFLEVSTLPKLSEASDIPYSLESVGLSEQDFLYHLLLLALER